MIGTLIGIFGAWLLFGWHMPGGLLPALGLVAGWRWNRPESLGLSQPPLEGRNAKTQDFKSKFQGVSSGLFLLFLILAIIIQSPRLGMNEKTSDAYFMLFGGMVGLSGCGFLLARTEQRAAVCVVFTIFWGVLVVGVTKIISNESLSHEKTNLIVAAASMPLGVFFILAFLRTMCEFKKFFFMFLLGFKNRKICKGEEIFFWVYRPPAWKRVGLEIFAVMMLIIALLVTSGNPFINRHRFIFFILFIVFFFLVNSAAHPIFYLATSQGLWQKTEPVIWPGDKLPKRFFLLFPWQDINFFIIHKDRIFVYPRPKNSWLRKMPTEIIRRIYQVEIWLPVNEKEIQERIKKIVIEKNTI